MPRMTVLEMTQNILSAIDGDEVNSISDTVESLQVAEVLRETYYELFSGESVPSRYGLFQLDSVSDVNRPNYLRVPSNVKNVDWVKYDYQTDNTVDYNDITYLTPQEFIIRQRSFSENGLLVTDTSGAKFYIQTDTAPHFWTTFDNLYVVFDSYNQDVESTLQNSKSLCWGQYDPLFSLEDLFVPELDADLFPYLLAEAKSVCFINLKGVSSSKEEQRSRRQRVRKQNDSWRLNQRKPYNRTPNYGRSSAGHRKSAIVR